MSVHTDGTLKAHTMNGRLVEKFVRDETRNVVPGSRVVSSGEVTCVGVPHAHERQQPVIELIREGDVVTAIDVTCSCGEKLRLWCSYES
jgi:hypothetical protein